VPASRPESPRGWILVKNPKPKPRLRFWDHSIGSWQVRQEFSAFWLVARIQWFEKWVLLVTPWCCCSTAWSVKNQPLARHCACVRVCVCVCVCDACVLWGLHFFVCSFCLFNLLLLLICFSIFAKLIVTACKVLQQLCVPVFKKCVLLCACARYILPNCLSRFCNSTVVLSVLKKMCDSNLWHLQFNKENLNLTHSVLYTHTLSLSLSLSRTHTYIIFVVLVVGGSVFVVVVGGGGGGGVVCASAICLCAVCVCMSVIFCG